MFGNLLLLRQTTLCLALLGFCAASQVPELFGDYSPIGAALLHPRAQCPANTFQCPLSLGAAFDDFCCQTGQVCALDSNHLPACCPSGVVCTGVAPVDTAQRTATPATSFVSNSYLFSFPYAPTSFPDSASCASAVSACSHNYDACITQLGQGNAFPVTIDVPGGRGITVGPSQTGIGEAKASSVCSSLSSQACSTLAPGKCSSFGQKSAANSAPPIPLLLLGLLSCVSSMMAFITPQA